MKFIDYYKVLGVDENADAAAIKKAYRRLARKYHPDVSKEADAEEQFKKVSEAYEVLHDAERRAEYDQLRRFGARPGEEFRPPPGWQARGGSGDRGFSDAEAAGFSEFFRSMFGERAAGPGPAGRTRAGGVRFAIPGEDIHYRIRVTLEDSYHGASRALTLQTHRFDDEGHVLPETRTLNVKIPKGVTDGQRIRLKGQGGAGFGGAPDGDLYMEVELEPHGLYTVEGKDLSLVLPVAPWEAGLGATVKVPTLGGPVNLAIKPGAQSGQKLRLAGRGLPGKPPGDQYVVLKIVMPRLAGAADRELLEKMREQMSFNPRETLGV